MEPQEGIKNPQELDRTVDKFLQSCMTCRETKGEEKTPLVDPTTINP